MKAMALLCRTVNIHTHIQFFTAVLREFKDLLNLAEGPSLIRFLALVYTKFPLARVLCCTVVLFLRVEK